VPPAEKPSAHRTKKLPRIHIASVNAAPGTPDRQVFFAGTERWYSVVMKPTESTSTDGQYSCRRGAALSGMTSATTSGPASTSGTSTMPISSATT
jgi:hypothetical protein